MKYTSSGAAKLLRSLKEERDLLLSNEEKCKWYTVIGQEDPQAQRPEYDYEGIQKSLEEIEAKIRVIKHALNCFNTVTRLPGMEMTIDQALIYLPQLTARKKKLSRMQDHLPRERSNRDNFLRSPQAEYELINYDREQVRADYRKVSEELAAVQTALDLVNVTELMDIDI